MKKEDVKKIILPNTPGVYFFRNIRRQILYIGKATSLKDRVKSYFSKDIDKSRGPLIVQMLEEASTVTFEQTDSVLEALILEANLIKKYQPRYNSKEKDNKSFNYLIVTKEEYPRVLIIRGRELLNSSKISNIDVQEVFGPFPQGGVLKDAIKIVRKIFPFRDTCTPDSDKFCFNAQIGLCAGVCGGLINTKEYTQTIRHIILFFKGKKQVLIKKLEVQMRKYARDEKFEQAASIRKQIFALEHLQDVSLIRSDLKAMSGGEDIRIEGYDVAHTSGENTVGVMTVLVGGEIEKKEYRKFTVETVKNNDVGALYEILARRMKHDEWNLPQLIVVDGGTAQVRIAKKVLTEFGYKIPVVGVTKDDHHKPLKIIGDKTMAKVYERDIL